MFTVFPTYSQQILWTKKEFSHDWIIWISWPKGTSGIATDSGGNMVGEVGLN
jgi:hypothetical protein